MQNLKRSRCERLIPNQSNERLVPQRSNLLARSFWYWTGPCRRPPIHSTVNDRSSSNLNLCSQRARQRHITPPNTISIDLYSPLRSAFKFGGRQQSSFAKMEHQPHRVTQPFSIGQLRHYPSLALNAINHSVRYANVVLVLA